MQFSIEYSGKYQKEPVIDVEKKVASSGSSSGSVYGSNEPLRIQLH